MDMLIKPIWLIVFCSCLVHGFTVYDCESLDATFEKLSMLDLGACQDSLGDFMDPEELHVQVFRYPKEMSIEGYLCNIKVSRTVTRCDSLPSFITTEDMKTYFLTPEDCYKAVKEEKFHFENKTFDFTRGQEVNAKYLSRGIADKFGYNCSRGEQFVSGGIQFENHMEEVSLSASFKTIEGKRNIPSDLVVFLGKHADFKKGQIEDAYHGAISWDTEAEPTCNGGLVSLYDGHATIRMAKDAKDLDNSIAMVSLDGGRLAGFKLQGKRTICGGIAYATNYEGTFFHIGDSYNPPQFEISNPKDDTILGFLHSGINMNYDSFKEVQEEACESERSLLEAKLNNLSSGNKQALIKEYGPGHRFRMTGAAAYVTKCTPVDATFAHIKNCTHEIPVHLGPNTAHDVYFADPIMFTITKHPIILPCDAMNPVMWFVADRWVCKDDQGLNLHCTAPKELKLEGNIGFDGQRKGFYPKNQFEAHRYAQMTYDAIEATEYKITNEALKGAIQTKEGTWELGLPLVNSGLSWLKDNFLENWIFYSPILLYALLRAINFFCSLCWGFRRHRTCGKWILGLFFDRFVDTLNGIPKAVVKVHAGGPTALKEDIATELRNILP